MKETTDLCCFFLPAWSLLVGVLPALIQKGWVSALSWTTLDSGLSQHLELYATRYVAETHKTTTIKAARQPYHEIWI